MVAYPGNAKVSQKNTSQNHDSCFISIILSFYLYNYVDHISNVLSGPDCKIMKM